jgi:large subunit ribosomal protein L22
MAVITVQASAKGIRMAPRKIGLIASLVRGRTVADALTILEYTPKRAALPVSKVIASAKANAVHNHNVQGDTLQIVELNVGPGTRMKRYRPISRGMAHPYQKRTTHITVVVAGEEKAKPKAKVTTTAKEKK